jgi:hypothetical protein
MPGSPCQPRDPVEQLLRRIVHSAAVLLSAGWAPACGDSHPDAAGDDAVERLEPVAGAIACEPENLFFAERPVRVDQLALTQRFDYVALRTRTTVGEPTTGVPAHADEHWSHNDFRVVSEMGSACATATDARCAGQVAQHPQELVTTFACPMGCVEDSLVTTRGDQVERWAGVARIKQLVGTIDTKDEAILVVLLDGYWVRCGQADEGSVAESAGGFLISATELTDTCPITKARVRLEVSAQGTITKLATGHSESAGCAGRKPAGLLSQVEANGASALGDYLARAAHLEAASVFAFERMAQELAALGAPDALIDDARKARADEVRHSQAIERLARARGGAPVAAVVAHLPARSLEEIALENAVEGCVRETYGALVGGYQALCARDLELYAAMQPIAEDETRHAGLSHRVHAWLWTKLDAAARQRVRHAQQRAIFALAAELHTPMDESLRRALGLPTPEVAQALLRQLNRSLWQPQLRGADESAFG